MNKNDQIVILNLKALPDVESQRLERLTFSLLCVSLFSLMHIIFFAVKSTHLRVFNFREML